MWMSFGQLRFVAALTAALLLGGACGGDGDEEEAEQSAPTEEPSGSAGASGDAVAIEDFEFGPEELTVEAGTTVRWTNEDDAAHSVQGEEGGEEFESDDLAQGDTFEHQYAEAGDYPYDCGIHSYMKGTVVVE